MAINRSLLDTSLKNSVIEMKWVRRVPKSGAMLTRRALATNSPAVLMSEFGVKVLNFRPPSAMNSLNQEAHNLVTYWDLFRQEYRNSACESLHMIRIFPVTNPTEINNFWVFFRDNIRDMTAQQKIEFMDK